MSLAKEAAGAQPSLGDLMKQLKSEREELHKKVLSGGVKIKGALQSQLGAAAKVLKKGKK